MSAVHYSVRPKTARYLRCECTGIAERVDRRLVIERIFLGIQGWNHPEWIGRIYAASIPSSDWLREYAQRFPTVEVDDTFYGIPPEPMLRQWREAVPRDFSFALKVPQQITHEQRFTLDGGLLTRFLDRVSLLGENLGAILLIAPPGFEPNDATTSALRRFVDCLSVEFRWALELKHIGWFDEEFHDLAARKNVAIVTGENRWIRRKSMLTLLERPTADFAYVRWGKRSNDGIEAEQVTFWKDALVRLSGLVGSVYGYFHVGAFGDGLRSADELQRSIAKRTLEASVPVDRDAS